MKKILIMLSITTFLFSGNIKPISSTTFINNGKKISIKGKKTIIISLYDKLFFAINTKGKTVFFGEISSGKPTHKTPEGYYPIIARARHHMSNKYDSGTGINNMDYMLKIKKDGTALHAGDVGVQSQGCVHINEIDAPDLYKWAKGNTRVVITRNSYLRFSR